MESYAFSALFTIAVCVFMLALAFRVGLMRGKHKVQTHETYICRNKEFVIAHRIQVNTMENVLMFLPVFWIAALYGIELLALLTGVLWFISRIAYAYFYAQDPKKRGKPFILGIVCFAITLIHALIGIFFSFMSL